MKRRASATLLVRDLLLRAFLLFGLIGLPLVFTEWLGWWSAEGWIRTGLFVWLFIFGIGLFLITVCVAIGALAILFLLVDLWVSLLLASLGLRPAMQHFRDTCSRVGDLLIALGQPLKSLDLSFPVDDYRSPDSTKAETLERLQKTLLKSVDLTPKEKAVVGSPIKLHDIVTIPHDAMQIIGEYGKVLADNPRLLRPISLLPYPKDTIKQAIETALKQAQDPDMRESLQVALEALHDFVPDEKVPQNCEEDVKAWLLHRTSRTE